MGGVTIPKEIAEKLDLNPGDQVIVTLEGDSIRIVPVEKALKKEFLGEKA